MTKNDSRTRVLPALSALVAVVITGGCCFGDVLAPERAYSDGEAERAARDYVAEHAAEIRAALEARDAGPETASDPLCVESLSDLGRSLVLLMTTRGHAGADLASRSAFGIAGCDASVVVVTVLVGGVWVGRGARVYAGRADREPGAAIGDPSAFEEEELPTDVDVGSDELF